MSSGSGKSNNCWFVSLPLKHRNSPCLDKDRVEEDRNVLLAYLQEKLVLQGGNLCELHAITLPLFKVGTLDSLVAAGEDLGPLDGQFETIVDRLVGYLRTLCEGDLDRVRSSLIVDELTPDNYVKTFEWNALKYRVDRPIAEVVENLRQEMNQIDQMTKAKMTAYQQSKASLGAVERRQAGSLLTRDLAGVITKEDYANACQDSEYLTTLLVVIPQAKQAEWEAGYEQLTPMVVPRSAKLLAREADHSLYAVSLFHKVRDEFCAKAVQHGYTVRTDFCWDQAEQDRRAKESARLTTEHQAQWAALLRLVQTNFGEAFSTWMHLKAVRLLVESVLRYGLPSAFLSFLLKPKGAGKQLGKLNKTFLQCLERLNLPGISPVDLTAALNSVDRSTPMDGEEAELWNALSQSQRDFDPYVKLEFKCDY